MNIPEKMKRLPNWVCWRAVPRGNGKIDKQPVNAKTGGNAQSNNPDTWTNFETAVTAVSKFNLSGIGFMFGNNVFGVDIDNCIQNGVISTEALDIINSLDSYTEISPSENGIHIYCLGKLPEGRRRKGNIEMYSEGRFFTVTGNVYGQYKDIQERTKEIAEIHRKYFPQESKTPTPLQKRQPIDLDDEEIIHLAMSSQNGAEFEMLYNGNWQGRYPSQSEADLAFCNMLAFWTGCDRERMDSIMRRSGLIRPKWDRKQSGTTYGQIVINKAISDCTNVFEPNKNNGGNYTFNSPGETIFRIDKKYTMDDTGNAWRFRDMHHNDVKYSYINKNWLFWDQKVWREDLTGEIKRKADETIERMWKELSKLPDSIEKPDGSREPNPEKQARIKWCQKTRFSKTKTSMITEAQHLEGMQIQPSEMDFRKDILNVQNGIIDLRTGELMKHDRAFYCTKIANAEYHKDAKAPLWESFLRSITGDDQELITFLKRSVGYSLTGSTKEQCAFFCYGTGANGKSTFLDIISELLGDYAMNCQPETIMMKSTMSQAAASDIARLKGARMVTTVEPAEGAKLNEGLVKQLTGGDAVTARFLYGKEFEYRPEFKIWMATNHKPVIRGTDEGIWRRIRLIPFTVTIPPDKQDKNLLYKLKKEMNGILAWAVEGCMEWQREGLNMPKVVMEAVQEYRSEMDILKTFLDECTEQHPFETVKSSELYQCYVNWAETNNEYIMKHTKFGREMGKRYENKKTRDGKVYCGLKIKNEYKSLINPYRKHDSAYQFSLSGS